MTAELLLKMADSTVKPSFGELRGGRALSAARGGFGSRE